MPSVAQELWLDFYEDTKEHVATLYHLLENATDKYVISGLSHGINICKYRVLKMYCDELLEDEHLLFIKHMESIAPEVIIDVPIDCRRHVGCSCQKRQKDEAYEAALKRLTSGYYRSQSETDTTNAIDDVPIVDSSPRSLEENVSDSELQRSPMECHSSDTADHDGVISEETVSEPDDNHLTELQTIVVDEDYSDNKSRRGMKRNLPRCTVADHSRDWHSLIERLGKAEAVSDITYEDYTRFVGLALADGRVDTDPLRKLPKYERFKGGGPSEWEKETRALVAIPTLAEVLALFI